MHDTGSTKGYKLAERAMSLLANLKGMGRVALAYSGGVDSTYLLHSCLRALGPDAVLAIVVDHPFLKEGEALDAVNLARRMGANVHSVELDPSHIGEVSGNAASRCYHCKKFIFSYLREYAAENKLEWLLDGTNADDCRVYRPGLKALEELGVKSPLREAELTKVMIRELSRSDGLETWNKPSAPCLATRFPYGQHITEQSLEMVSQGEAFLRAEGFEDLRLRVHGDIARVEVPDHMIGHIVEEGKRQRLVAALKALGYRYITLDLEGLRSGSMDESDMEGNSPSDSEAVQTIKQGE
jgi:uncharacterized protein